MNSKLRFVPVLGMILLLPGCATLINGARQDISVVTTPAGATVKVNGMSMGTTPVTLALKRKQKNQRLEIELAGYHPYQLEFRRSVSGWYAGNLIFGGIIGLVLDPISGGMFKLSPDLVSVTLTKNESSAAHLVEDHLLLVLSTDVDPRWEKVGQLRPLPVAR